MRTCTYIQIQNLAAELAGRTRDKLPPSEATMLLGFIAVELDQLWNSQAWPELNPDIEAITVTNRQFSKREGDADEIGDVLGIYSANPATTTRFRSVGFSEIDETVRIDESLASVYVDYLLPAPELLEVAAAALDATEIPLRFKKILAFRAGAFLRGIDGQLEMAGSLLGVASSALADELRRLPPEPPWRGVRKVRDYAGSITGVAITG